MRELTPIRYWRFHLGAEDIPTPDQKSALYSSAKTVQRRYGFASALYVEDQNSCPDLWKPVRTPHDYVVNLPYDKDRAGAICFHTFPEAWYRTNLNFTEEDKARRIVLMFEAVATDCEVFLNGIPIVQNHSAYTPFEADISDFIVTGKNLLAVCVKETRYHESWWYSGAGITRDVWLLKTDPTAVDVRGVWVRPVKTAEDEWRVDVETTLTRGAKGEDTVTVRNTLAGQTAETAVTVPAFGKAVVKQSVTVKNPDLWSCEIPVLYTCETELLRNGESIDKTSDRFGFRTIEYKTDGFYLNGKLTPMNGVCVHEDYALTGRAVPESIRRLRVKLLTTMKCNAYRCSHYMQSAGTMNALDDYGFLVMAETRHFSTSAESLEQLEKLVKRDRNHPSVVMWSIGNEEATMAESRGAKIAARMASLIRELDPDRPVTAAVSNSPATAPIMDELDLLGINYNVGQEEKLFERLQKPQVYSECAACSTSAGYFGEQDDILGYMPAYDRKAYSWSSSVVTAQKIVNDHPYMVGGFQWAGFEYRGETEWPRLCSQCGSFDFFLRPKVTSYLMRAIWDETPLVHIVPHWNFEGREGEEIPVMIYTNCAKIALYVNGRLFGTKESGKFTPPTFYVPYESGELVAIGYDAQGKEVATDRVKTTGKAVGYEMVIENKDDIRHNGDDVAHVTVWAVDADGNRVPDAEDDLVFYISGAGAMDFGAAGVRPTILGTGSSVCDPVEPQSRRRHMVNGSAVCAVRLGDGKVKAYLVVKSEKYKSASVEI